MIQRQYDREALRGLLKRHRVVGVLGARQVGKTTLARLLARAQPGPVHWFDLEDPADVARLGDPMLALRGLQGTVVLDEVQMMPGLFKVLRVLADRPRGRCRFLVLGSASPELLQQTAESLAGRIAYYEMTGFGLDEVKGDQVRKLWRRGGFPRAFLARTERDSLAWRQQFIKTFLERDLPQLGINIGASTLRRFWTMLAHYHGQVWNASEFARAFGVADTTVRGYLDRLEAALVVRQLQPWYANISKRQVKAPKVYVADSGLLHALLNLPTQPDLDSHPKVGASWEGFIVQQIIRRLGASSGECFFWGTHGGAELDLLVVRGRRRLGFEVKYTTAPSVTASMHHALADLKLSKLQVIHAGDQTFPLTNKIQAVAASRILQDVKRL